MTFKPFTLHAATEWAKLPPPRWLVPGFLAEKSLAVIFGASGCGKSFLASHLAHVLASGLDWRAGAIDPAGVLYLAAENPGSLAPRFAATQAHLGGDFPGLYLVADEINLLADTFVDQVEDGLRKAAETGGLRIGLIVIDTLRDSWPGNEDSSTEVSRAFAPLKAIRDRHGLCVLLIHHSGHNGDRERGSSHIRANADTVWQVEERGQQRVVTCLKMRDAAKPEPFAFTLEPTGDSCIVTFSDEPAKSSKARPLSSHQRLALDSLADRIVEAGEPLPSGIGVSARGILCADWRHAFYSRLGDTTDEAKRKAFQRSMTELQARNAVAVRDGYAWTC